MKLFYEPNNAYFGDCMPFYHDDTFYVFHQRDARNPRPFEPFEWSLSTTKDFVHYEDKGVAIPKEGDDSPEQYIFAGSVFEGNHKFHAIYTAYNRDFAAQGKDAQVLMSAESDDLLNWKKTGKFVLPAPEGYDGNDWRDPFILWEEESQQYIMILGARKLEPEELSGLHQKICRNGILRAIFGHLKHSRCMKCRICLKWVTGGIYLPQNTVKEVKQSIV